MKSHCVGETKMSFIKIARERRSIRRYKDKRVSSHLIQELLEAARLAPSGCNVQPWRYIILSDRYSIDNLQIKGIFWQKFIYNVPTLIIGSGDPSEYYRPLNQHTLDNQIEHDIQPEDAAQRMEALFKCRELERLTRDVTISMTYMMLRAYELGLGTCPIGCFDRDKLREHLKMHESLVPILALAVGYPDEKPAPTWRKPLDNMTP